MWRTNHYHIPKFIQFITNCQLGVKSGEILIDKRYKIQLQIFFQWFFANILRGNKYVNLIQQTMPTKTDWLADHFSFPLAALCIELVFLHMKTTRQKLLIDSVRFEFTSVSHNPAWQLKFPPDCTAQEMWKVQSHSAWKLTSLEDLGAATCKLVKFCGP